MPAQTHPAPSRTQQRKSWGCESQIKQRHSSMFNPIAERYLPHGFNALKPTVEAAPGKSWGMGNLFTIVKYLRKAQYQLTLLQSFSAKHNQPGRPPLLRAVTAALRIATFTAGCRHGISHGLLQRKTANTTLDALGA